MVTTDAVRLRPAQAQDAPAVAALHADSWRRHYRGAYSDAYLDGDVVADRLQIWSERLREPGNALTLLAEVDDQLVGFAHTIFDHDPALGSLLENLHVTAARQRSGVGRRLLAAAAQAVTRRPQPGPLHLWVLEQNESAQSFYRAMGGTFTELALCPPPGGFAERLRGQPKRLRVEWPDPSLVATRAAGRP